MSIPQHASYEKGKGNEASGSPVRSMYRVLQTIDMRGHGFSGIFLHDIGQTCLQILLVLVEETSETGAFPLRPVRAERTVCFFISTVTASKTSDKKMRDITVAY